MRTRVQGSDGGLPCLRWVSLAAKWMRRNRQLYCAPAYCGLVPKMEKLGVRSSKCRHQSSSQTDVSLSVVVAVKLVIQCDVVQLRKKKKKVSFCVSGFCVGNQKLSRSVCFLLEDYLSNQRAALWKQGSLFIIKRNLSYCVEGRFREGEKRDKTQSLQFIIIFYI